MARAQGSRCGLWSLRTLPLSVFSAGPAASCWCQLAIAQRASTAPGRQRNETAHPLHLTRREHLQPRPRPTRNTEWPRAVPVSKRPGSRANRGQRLDSGPSAQSPGGGAWPVTTWLGLGGVRLEPMRADQQQKPFQTVNRQAHRLGQVCGLRQRPLPCLCHNRWRSELRAFCSVPRSTSDVDPNSQPPPFLPDHRILDWHCRLSGVTRGLDCLVP